MYVLVCGLEETPVFPVVLTTKFFETGSLSGIRSSAVRQINGASEMHLSLSPELRDYKHVPTISFIVGAGQSAQIPTMAPRHFTVSAVSPARSIC